MTICRTDYFFLKECLQIKDISGIKCIPTFTLGNSSVSINIIGVNDGVDQHITMSSVGFTMGALASVVSNLKKRNPAIQLDKATSELVKKYGDQSTSL